MTYAEQLREALLSMAESHGPAIMLIGKVVDVDIAALTCVVDDGDGTPIYDVRLQPVIVAEQSCIIFPKIGSIAAILKLDSYPETWQLMWSSNIQSLVARADTIKLNGGNNKVNI